jgi:glycine hydroxymethyltransferase
MTNDQAVRENSAMPTLPGSEDTPESQILELVRAERRRQWETLVLIPSESICHPDALGVLASPFSNIYAEGRPAPALLHDPREAAADPERFQSWQTRLADGRYYRGCVHANRAELLAHKFIADAYAALDDSPGPEHIHVAVQALSGAPANTAVYEALLEHGDTLLGLDLAHGGHLTHGSEFNYSGKTFRVISYGIDETTRRLDYARIRELAVEHRPKLIIGGASSYPWDFDWAKLRRIADDVGAFLLADIAHLAGMVAAGLLNNPLPHAHVVTHTTHKTLCGPRGAVILTTYPDLHKRIEAGVFPGLQGGPHVHSIAAIARRFEIINEDRDAFVRLQQAILDNAAFLAECLVNEGFELEYGGTNTHMLLVDLKRFADHPNPAIPIDGEIASRLLEIGGIVCNKNVLPGDATGGRASGLRLGTPWLTQRGVTRDHLHEIASVMREILSRVRTFRVWVPAGEERCRGKIEPCALERAAARVHAIVDELPHPPRPPAPEPAPPVPEVRGRAALLLRGEKVSAALDQMLTCPVAVMREGECVTGKLLRSDGSEVAEATAVRLDRVGREERFALLVPPERLAEVRAWIRDLSDGYLMFDEEDLYAKVDGPTVVEPLPEGLVDRLPDSTPEVVVDRTKPYFIGQRAVYAQVAPAAKAAYAYEPPERPVRRTVLNETHRWLGGKMVEFAGWEMPVRYPDGIPAEHRAVRTAAGLFDVSHMSLFEISGPGAAPFLDVVLANCISRLDPGEAQYTYILYPDGTAIDDLYVYRLERDRFMVVANAADAERDHDWLEAVNARNVIIDPAMPGKQIERPVSIRDLREDGRVGLALQGPVSARLLADLADKSADRFAVERLRQNRFVSATIAGIECLVAGTGYTGEAVGFELYVAPDRCVDLWNTLLDAGEGLGVRPVGLGARDSARTEAGFPLFGHELEGPCELSLTEAGYGFVTRFHVPFFVGRDAYIARVRASRQRVIRLRGRGRRSVRPGHAVLRDDGSCAGQVTSFAYTSNDFTFFVLAAVDADFIPEPGMVVRAVRQPADRYQAPPKPAAVVELTALTRFPDDDERAAWPDVYG